MDNSIFLAKVLGLYILIMGIVMLVKEKKVKVVIKEVCNDPAMLFLTGAISLIAGLLLVVTHNIWVTDWRVLVTLVGWLALIRGLVRMLFPHLAVRAMNGVLKKKSTYRMLAILALVLGVVLTYYGSESHYIEIFTFVAPQQ